VEKSIDGALAVLAEHRVLELDLEVDPEAVVGLEARPLVAVLDLDGPRMRTKRFGADCSSMPADCIRNTNGPALPSMIGTSGADSSTKALSMPSPASADSRCSTVDTVAPPAASVVPSVVSVTLVARAGMSTAGSRSRAAEDDADVRRRRAQHHEHLAARSAGRRRWRGWSS
jgi:hypothetical protein